MSKGLYRYLVTACSTVFQISMSARIQRAATKRLKYATTFLEVSIVLVARGTKKMGAEKVAVRK
jgi:hypothetical protein